jgi:hypothetical protein
MKSWGLSCHFPAPASGHDFKRSSASLHRFVPWSPLNKAERVAPRRYNLQIEVVLVFLSGGMGMSPKASTSDPSLIIPAASRGEGRTNDDPTLTQIQGLQAPL